MTFRTRSFITALGTAAVTLIVAVVLGSWNVRRTVGERIERGLVNEARLAAETLSHRQPATPDELDAEADALGRILSARVTFIAPDGRVVGDSGVSSEALLTLENHSDWPEVQQARRSGLGVERRYSATLDIDMLYVAVAVRNPAAPMLSEVRLAVPLVEIRDQLTALWRTALIAAGAGLGAALLLAWMGSALLSWRVRAIAEVAARYSAGDFSRPTRDYGNDEVGVVARTLDGTVREIARRAHDLATDRARMEAILSGMAEGVVVVNTEGRVQLANAAARRMLRLQEGAEGRHYLEIVRDPDIAAQVSAALAGREGESVELALQQGLIVTVRSTPVAADRTTGAVVVLHDITDLRRADRVRRDFVANVSHELRTPLTAVKGYVEALIDGGAEGPSARKFLEIIARHTLRMERLVRDLLRLARLDAGQEQREHLPCAVAGLFGGVEADIMTLLESRGVDVKYRDRERRRDRIRRSRGAPRCVSESARERGELLAGTGRRRDGLAARRQPDSLDRDRSGPRHPRRRSCPRVRTVLSSRQGTIAWRAGSRRHRPGSGDRQAPGGTARRPGASGERPRGRRGVHRGAARRLKPGPW